MTTASDQFSIQRLSTKRKLEPQGLNELCLVDIDTNVDREQCK